MSQLQPDQLGLPGQSQSAVLASQYPSAGGLAPAVSAQPIQGQGMPQIQPSALTNMPAAAQSQQAPLGHFSTGSVGPHHAPPSAHASLGHEQQPMLQSQLPPGQHQVSGTQHQALPAFETAQPPGQAVGMHSNLTPAPDQRQPSNPAPAATGSPDFQGAAQKLLVDISNIVLFDQQGAVIFSTYQVTLAVPCTHQLPPASVDLASRF